MSKEVWKDVVGYEGLYKISNHGNVYSNYTNKCLRAGTHKDGYKYVNLTKDGEKKYKTIHRLVAEAFIPNPDNLPMVNHRDETPSNNNVDNLEWCDCSYNNTYNNIHIRRASAISKKIYVYNKNGELIDVYKSTRDIAKSLNVAYGNVSTVCNSNYRTLCGFVISYNELTKQEVLDIFRRNKERKYINENIGEYIKETKSKKVNQYDLDGNFICSYPSTQEAARQLHISNSLISRVCLGKGKQTHGWIFKYEDIF